jgi:DNA-binding NtrC family response regulator
MSAEAVKILFVDDDPVTGRVMKRQCGNVGYQCNIYQSAREGLESFKTEGADLIITDLRMPEMNGFELLNAVRSVDPEIPVLVMTGYSSVENAVEAMKSGATDFIKKPFDFEELKLLLDRTMQSVRLKKENSYLKARLQDESDRFGMIGNTPAMEKLYNTVEKVAGVDCNVVITGESGSGKELVARALHDYSPRSEDGPFVVIDCGALPETLLESELFGHEKGSFTGATHRKRGLMEQANGGTLFLDEICNIPDAMQVKLMRAIEAQKIIRVGGTEEIPIDLRIVAASNRDLEKMVEEGSLRHDFYHRLNVVNIRVPSLNERRDDIPRLVEKFLKEFSQRYNRDVSGFDNASIQRLIHADWTGNIRQLKNIVERCVILADAEVLQWDDPAQQLDDEDILSLFYRNDEFVSLEELEKRYIRHVLNHCEGKKVKAAELLGIDKTTLWRKLQRYEQEEAVV